MKNKKKPKQIGNNLTTLVLKYEKIEVASIIPAKPEIPIANAISRDCTKMTSTAEK